MTVGVVGLVFQQLAVGYRSSIDGVHRNFKNYRASPRSRHFSDDVTNITGQFATGDIVTKFTPQLGDSGRLIPPRNTPTFVDRRHALVLVCLDDGRHICNGSCAYEIFITNNYLQN